MDFSLPGSPVHWISQARILCHSFLQGILLTQRSVNLHLLHCRQILYCWVTREAYIYIYKHIYKYWWATSICGLPRRLSGKEPCQRRRSKRHDFNPWVGKVSWRREWQPTPIFLPGNFHGQGSLVGYGIKSQIRLIMHTQVYVYTNIHSVYICIMCIYKYTWTNIHIYL